jgi:hypothetical protein
VADSGPNQETSQRQVGRESRFEGAKRRVKPSKADSAIGGPTHPCRKGNVAERSPQPHQSDREDESVSQQTIEHESTRHRPRAARDRNCSAGECG